MSNKELTSSIKQEPAYTKDLLYWIMNETKGGEVHKTNDGKDYWWFKEHHSVKGQWVWHNIEDHRKRARTSSRKGGSTKIDNTNLTLTKDFKAFILTIKDQNDVQALISQFNLDLDTWGNE